MLKKYETVLFDIDDTLLDFHACGKAALRRAFLWHGLEFHEEDFATYLSISNRLWREMEQGTISQQTVLTTRFVELFQVLGYTQIDTVQFGLDYQELLSEEHELMPGALDIVQYLYGKGYRIYLVSNSEAETQFQRIRLCGMKPYIQGIFTADLVGFQKPTPQFFHFCFQQIPDFDRKKTIIIGDSLTSDIAGGNCVEIATCWYHPRTRKNPLQIPYDYEIIHFEELKKIL